MQRYQGRVVAVTGAAQGLGLAMAQRFAAEGATVVLADRSAEALTLAGDDLRRTAPAGLRTDIVDVTSSRDVDTWVADVHAETGAIDVLINNAGITNNSPWETEPFDIMRAQFEVNALAPIEVTRRLLPSLASNAKIVMISSRLGSIANTTAAIPDLGYRMSKAALNIAGKLIAESLKPNGTTVMMIHPGYVKTEMNFGDGDIDAATSAKGVIALIDRVGPDQTGTYWHVNGEQLPW